LVAMAEQDYIHMPTLEEYAERFKNFFKFKRSDDGILEVTMHTFGGHVHWSYQMHHALSELWTVVGHDTKNELLIFTSTGEKWIAETDASSFKDVEDSPDDDQRFNVQIYDTLKVVENFVNDIEIPTIAVINGRGIHWETALMSDITLCTPDFILQDDHFGMHSGMVPGDGQTMALQMILGIKRGNYLAYTLKGIDAQACLELGAVNEIVERDKILDRAWELARLIMKTNRSTRRLTHHLAVRPWRALVEQNLRQQVYAEMYSFNLVKSQHDFDYIQYADEKMAKM
jgi:enoyl-CoA hydratase/carnithine racemase